jgi:hypothetical protein
MVEFHELVDGPAHVPHARQIQVGWLGATGTFYPWPITPTREQEPGSYMPVYGDEEDGPDILPQLVADHPAGAAQALIAAGHLEVTGWECPRNEDVVLGPSCHLGGIHRPVEFRLVLPTKEADGE